MEGALAIIVAVAGALHRIILIMNGQAFLGIRSPQWAIEPPPRRQHGCTETEAAIATQDDIRSGLVAHLRRLWRYALVLSRQREAADDLVQSTCVRAIERAAQFTAGTRLDRWLFSILHSIWIDEVRSRKVRSGQGFVDADSELVIDTTQDVEARITANQVLRQIDALPEAQRATVFLAYVEGLSYREVSDVLDIPIGTVMSRLAGARAKLAEGPAAPSFTRTAEGRV